MAPILGGFLKLPRVRVVWGDINLSAYDGDTKGAPPVFWLGSEKRGSIVYDAEVDLSAEGEGPTGSFKWDPTGPAFAVYEWLISQPKYLRSRITITYFYPGGKKITLAFKWAGQKINYGNNMEVQVKLQSELAGLVNANQRSTAQAYDEKKGTDLLSVYDRVTEQYGLAKNKKILQYSKIAKEQAKKVKIENAYNMDAVYGSAISQLAKQAGHQVTANAVTKSGLVVWAPYSDKGSRKEEVINAASMGSGSPDPTKRYGFLLGPSVIDQIQRSYEYKPPQQSNSVSPATQTRAEDPKDGKKTQNSTAPEKAESTASAKSTSSPLGTSDGRANPNVTNKKNPKGPDRQNALNQEKGSTMSMDTFLTPILVGIKPNDIVFVPSLTGNYIEDWIVQSVSYAQSNGNIKVSIRATRTFNSKTSMNSKVGKEFLNYAKQQGLVGPNAKLKNWDNYAWGLRG
jgi:hypothetical protein